MNFLDTNVLLYGFYGSDYRLAAAERLLNGEGIISVQVMNEFANVMRRKGKREWPVVETALAKLELAFSIVPVTWDVHRRGIAVSKRYGLSVHDSMIVAAALLAGCRTLYSEDMQNGLLVEGVLRIVNPFMA